MIRSQALLDLEWVLTSPSLIDDEHAVGPLEFAPELVDADHLEAFVAERSDHRVGRYFESLIHYWLLHVSKVAQIEAGVQIIDDDRRTLGELDFVFDGLDGVRTHWEVAVKFFLHEPRADDSDFPGPNARDNFERKVGQLFDKQLPMSQIHDPAVKTRRALVRGCIFEHIERLHPLVAPSRLSSTHLRGSWLHANEVHLLERYESHMLHLCPKPYWLAPIHGFDGIAPADFIERLAAHFGDGGHPLMASVRDSGASEVDRLCIVPDEWPG